MKNKAVRFTKKIRRLIIENIRKYDGINYDELQKKIAELFEDEDD